MIDGHHDRDKGFGSSVSQRHPQRGSVQVGRKARSPGRLEVELFLEQDHFLAHQRRHALLNMSVAAQFSPCLVVVDKILEAGQGSSFDDSSFLFGKDLDGFVGLVGMHLAPHQFIGETTDEIGGDPKAGRKEANAVLLVFWNGGLECVGEVNGRVSFFVLVGNIQIRQAQHGQQCLVGAV